MEYAIETNNLVKHYSDFTALNKLSIHVPAEKVYGFLGKNGSGKTTTIRVIMGLIKPDAGDVKIFGTDISKDRRSAVKKIGAIVETPGAYENLTAIENLSITAAMYGIQKNRIPEVLDLVGLQNVDNKRVGNFSLGMRQRLGIANALIHNPKIIILDEPTNGLDPEGIKEMRAVIKNLTENLGISVLISSHLLSEIEQIADYVGIIQDGHLLQETETMDLKRQDQSFVMLETNRICETIDLLIRMRYKFAPEEDKIRVYCHKCENAKLNQELINNGIQVWNLASVSKTLEERFLDLTKEDN